jgi:antitoxin component YwqK of YwqJK toxin-antitoxin module
MKWFLCLITLITSVACSKVIINEDAVGAGILYAKNSYKPFTGKGIVLYRNSKQVKEQFTYKEGILDGEAISWYSNGRIHWEGLYVSGQIAGKWTFWDNEGNKILQASYKEDNLNGAYLSLYANGKIQEQGQYLDNERTGTWACYDEKGEQIQVVPHKVIPPCLFP